MVKAGKNSATYRLHDRLIATLLVFALFISTFAIVGPITKASALSSKDTGKIEFDDANINYDSNLKDNGNGSYTLDLSFWSDITKDDASKDQSKSSDGYFEAQFSGEYLVELWGGNGAKGSASKYNAGGVGGKGGHLYGVIKLEKGDILYYNIGGNGVQTEKQDDGGGANGTGGGHGNIGSYRVGGGGGYSAVFLFHNGAEATAFKTNYLDADGNLIKTKVDESDRTSKYIMVAAGGGGGGAGDGYILGYKPTGTADGGNGGSIIGSDRVTVDGGYVFCGTDGKSSGKKTTYVGKGATEVPGVVTKDFGLGLITGDKPNSWDGTANADLPGGAGAAGDLRGGAGGAGYMGASGGNMASLVAPGYIGGGGGGSSYISNRFTFNASSITDEIKNRESSSSKGGAVDITFIGANHSMQPTKDFSWLNELTFTAYASKYFDVTATSSDGTATVSGQQVTLKNATLGEDGKVHLSLTLTPKDAFMGGNNVNLFENTTAPEISVNNKNSTKTSSIDLSNDVSYVNVPLQNFEAIGKRDEINSGDQTSTAKLYEDQYASLRSNLASNSNYDFIESISNYYVKTDDASSIVKASSAADVTLEPVESTAYVVGYTVTPKSTTAKVGEVATPTDYIDIGIVDVLAEVTINGIVYNATKTISYDEATDKFTLKLHLSTSTRLRDKSDPSKGQVNDDYLKFTKELVDTTPKTFTQNINNGTSKSITIPYDGWYCIQATGGRGQTGQNVIDTATKPNTGAGGKGGPGDGLAGYMFFEKGDVINITAGKYLFLMADKKITSGGYGGTGGAPGTPTTVTWTNKDGETVGLAVAGAGGGGGGGALAINGSTRYKGEGKQGATAETEGTSGNPANIASTYEEALASVATKGEDGTFVDKKSATGGNGGLASKSYNGLQTDTSALSEEAAAKYRTQVSKLVYDDNPGVRITLLEEKLVEQSDVDGALEDKLTDISVIDYDFTEYFTDVTMTAPTAEEYANAIKVSEPVNNGDSTETTTARLSGLTWTFTFKAIDGFLGGNYIKALNSITLKQADGKVFYGNSTSTYLPAVTMPTEGLTNVGTVPADATTDYVNYKLTNPLSVTAVTEEKRVQYGTVVPLTDLFAVTDNWPDESTLLDDYVVKVTDTDFPGDSYTATANKEFKYTCGIKPSSETSKARVDKLVMPEQMTAYSSVVIFCEVSTTIDHMKYDGPTEVDLGKEFRATLTPEVGYGAPDSITVTVNGGAIADFTYDPATGEVVIPGSAVNGNIEISANGVAKEYTLMYRGYDENNALVANKDTNYLAGSPITDETAGLYTPSDIKGFKYVWDWQTDDGNPLSTMPATNYWVIGTYEPLFYTVQIKYVDTAGNEVAPMYVKDVWYTYEDSVNSPDVDGYKLETPSDVKVDININEAFADAHAENDTVLYKTVVYVPSDHNLSVRHTYTDTDETFDITYEKVNPGENYNVPAKTIPGYVSDVPSISGTMGAEKVTGEIKYSPADYTVSFVVDGNPYGTPITVTFKDEYGTLPTPTKAGKDFDGWYTADDTLVTATTEVTATSDHTLYAKWIELPEFSVSQTPDSWTNGTVTFDLTGTNDMVDYDDVTFYYSLDGGATYTAMAGTTLTISDEGVTDVKFKAVIDTREFESETYTAKIDKTKPTANITITTSVIKTILGGFIENYFNETVNATITAYDANSDIAKIEYHVVTHATEILTDSDLDAITTWTEGTHVSVDPDKQAVIYAKVTDKAGNVTYAATYGFITDKTVPEITDTSSANHRWFKDGDVVKVHVTDLLAGLDSVQIKIGDGEYADAAVDSDGNITIAISSLNEGSNVVTIKATDNSTNVNELALTLGRDNTAPTGTVTVDTNTWSELLSTLTFGLFFNTTQDVTITAADTDGSGVKKVEYFVTDKLQDKTELDAVSAWTTYTDGALKLNPDGEYVVYAKLTDNVGNVSYISSNGIVVDTYGPTVTVSYDYDSEWVTSDQTITGHVDKHLADVDEVTYSYTVGGVEHTGTLTFDADGNFTMPVTEDGQYVITISAKDKAGNDAREDQTITVWKDSVVPTIAVSAPSTDWVTDDTATVTIPNVGPSGVGSVQYKKDGDEGWTVITPDENGEYNVPITENGTYDFRVISTSGVPSDVTTVTYSKIDSTVPVLDITATSNSKTYNYNTAPWTNKDVIFTLTNTADNLAPITYKYKVVGDATYTDLGSNTFTDSTNGQTTYEVIAVSASGVESAPVTVKASVDKENPAGSVSVGTNTWTEFISTIDFLNIFYKDPVAVTVDASDSYSGISGKYYLIDHDQRTLEYIMSLTTGWTTYTGSSFTIENENNYVIYVMLIDNAGNKTYLSTDGIKIDKTEPIISVSYAEGDWTIDPVVNIPVSIADDANGCGVDETTISYTYSADAPGGLAGTTVTVGSADFTIPDAEIPDGEYVITVTAADKVGNVKTRDINIKRDSEGITVAAKPQDVTVVYGDAIATFVVNAKSTSALTYQWQKYNEATGEWENIPGATGSSYTVSNPSVVVDNGDQYRVILDSAAGWHMDDTAATLTVNPKLITISPDDQTVDYGQDDAALTYHTAGIINGDPVQFIGSFERTPGEEVGSYVITSKDFALDPDVEVNKNYYIEVNPTTADYHITEYNPGVVATLENKVDGENGWTVSEIQITAPAGFKISTSNSTDDSNVWSDYITVPDGEYGSGVEYYLKNVNDDPSNAHLGSISTKLVTPGFKQDTVAPEAVITVSESNLKKVLNDLTFGHFFKDTVGADITNANGADTSGLTYSYYVTDAVLTNADLAALDSSAWTDGTGVSVDPNTKVFIYARVKDGAGHTSYASSYGFVVDNTNPTLLDTNSADGKWITDADANVTITVSDELAGLDTVKYTVHGGTPITATVTDGKIQIPASALEEGVNTVVIKAVDNSTNESTLTLTLKKDTVEPAIDATADNTTIAQNRHIDITPTVGASDIQTITVTKPDGTVVDVTHTYTNGFVATENGDYVVTLVNGAGETVQETVTVSNIDTAKPVVSVSTGTYTEGEWSTSPVTVNADNTTANLGETTYQYSTDGGATWQDMPNGTLPLGDGTNDTYLIKATSAAGVESDPVSVVVKVDASAPTGKITIEPNFWEEVLSTITFGIYKNDSVTVKIEGTFDISGEDSIEYIKTTDIITSADDLALRTDWEEYTGSFEIPAVDQDKFVIYAKLTDNAGNVTYLSSDGHVFDLTDPVITVSSNTSATTEDGGTTYADRIVTVTDTNLDTVKVYKDGVEVTPAPTISGGTATIDIPNDGSTYVVVATDKAGNETSITINTKTVDDFIDELDDPWADPTDPTEEELKDAINKIDDFVEAEDDNLTQEEKDKLKLERDKLLEDYAEMISNRYGIVVIDIVSSAADVDDDAARATLKKFITGEDVEKFLDDQRVEIVMTIKEASGDSKNETKAEADGNAVIKHVEITIVKNVYADAADTTPASTTPITSTPEEIEFTVSAGEYTRDGRVFFVYRDHSNTSTRYADTDTDLSDDIVGFKSSLFSTFTLAYLPDATITGTVTGKDDKPINNATVELLDDSGNPVLDENGNPITTTTDENGNYSFDNLPDGDYNVQVTTPDGSDTNAKSVTVNPDGTSTPADISFPAYETVGDVSGNVTDKEGYPVPGSTVELVDKDGNPVLDDNGDPIVTTTDDDGNYIFEDIPEGDYKVKVTPPDGSEPTTSDEFTIQNGDAEDVDVTLDNYQRYTEVPGTVEDKNGDPVKGATVNLLDENGDPVLDKDGNPITATTDENGKYTFPPVEAGDYTVEVIAPHPDKDGNTDTTTTNIQVSNGSVMDEDGNKYPESTGVISTLENYEAFMDISGNVTDKNDKPLEGILVELLDKDGNPVLDEDGNPITTTTDENGDYIFKHIPEGEYIVKINTPDDVDPDVENPVELENGTVTGDTDAKFENYDGYGDIEGNVTDKNGTPQSGAKVELLDKDGNPITLPDGTPLVTYTDKNGNYIFKDVPNGTYQVRVTLPDGRTEIKTVIIENGQIPLAYVPNFKFDVETVVNTGDQTPVLSSLALLIASGFGSAFFVKKRKEEEEETN